MSANLQHLSYFKTKIEILKKNDEKIIQITAPHEIRDLTWDNIEYLDGDNFCSRKGINRTQFTVCPLPGYTVEHVLDLVMACVYLGNIDEKNPSVLFKVCDGNVVYSEVADTEVTFRKDTVDKFVQTLVAKKTFFMLKKHMENIEGRFYRVNVLKSWESEAAEALRRLKFSTPKPESTEDVEKEINTIRDGINLAININEQIANCREEAKNFIAGFKSRYLDIGYDKTIESTFTNSSNRLASIRNDVDKLMSSFDEIVYTNALHKVREKTPPAPIAE